MMIAVVDYGIGNTRSVMNAFKAIGQEPYITNSPKELAKASAIVLPGVGAFNKGMQNLTQLNLVDALNEQILIKQKPFLGICLGLHFLAGQSFENEPCRGFNWIGGSVRRIDSKDARYRVPHVGWNEVRIGNSHPLFLNLEGSPVFYFVHSYQLQCDDDVSDVISATCWHGEEIVAAVQNNNIFAVQFHPEKSQYNGLKVLENFVKII